MAKEISVGDIVDCCAGVYGEDTFTVFKVQILSIKSVAGFRLFLCLDLENKDVVIQARESHLQECDVISNGDYSLRGNKLQNIAAYLGFKL